MAAESSAVAVARNYLEAFGRKDFETCRKLLDNREFAFVGPMERHSTAESLIASMKKMEPMIGSVKIRKVIGDGTDVCAVYDFFAPASGDPHRIAELLTVRNGKIVRDELFFDASAFRGEKM